MPRRVDKYEEKTTTSRVNKNRELYQDIKNYEYVDVSEIEPVVKTISLSEINNSDKLERIKKVETLKTIEEIEKEINLPDKEYDINKVIDFAKKNRNEDELEEKRKLKKDDYNIAKNIDIDNIESIRENKKKQELSLEEEDEIKELIDTIYSNTLKGEIESIENENKDLFSDLMDDEEVEEKIESETDEVNYITNSDTDINDEINKAILEYKNDKKEEDEDINKDLKFDDSFFTKSLEIKKSDLLGEEDEMDDSFSDNNGPSLVKIILGIIFVVVILVIGCLYFIK